MTTDVGLVNSLNPKFQPYIKEVLTNGKVGVCAKPVQLKDVQCGGPSSTPLGCGDRMKLGINYGGQILWWEVVFNSLAPHLPPELYFDDETFLADPDVDELENNIPSLANWDPKDRSALLNVVLELLALYRCHQVDLLKDLGYQRVQFEYSILVGGGIQVQEDDVEVLVGNRTGRSRLFNGVVNFLIRLRADFSGLPPTDNSENPGEDAAVLLVTFHPPDGSRILPHPHLSPRVEKALGGPLNLPPFPTVNCLMDYVPLAAERLRDRINVAVANYEKRRDYLAVLQALLSGAVLEYDAISFSRITLLLERRDFHFIVHVKAPSFPHNAPQITLQSVYHAVYGKPFRINCDECPYSPRWSAREMVERTLTYIRENVDEFQRKSVQSSHI